MTADTSTPLSAGARARMLEKFAMAGGVSVGSALLLLGTLSPDTIKAAAAIGWPGAAFGMFTVGVVVVRNGMQILDTRAGQAIGKIGEMSSAVERQALSIEKLSKRDDEQYLRSEALLEETADRTKRILAWIDREEERRGG